MSCEAGSTDSEYIDTMKNKSSEKLKVIITGATGMVGEGVAHECLHHENVDQVLIINRKPSRMNHVKLKEIIHTDFFNISSIEHQLKGYNACFFCLGVSSVGMSEADYTSVTYDLTMNVARTLSRLNPDMTFCYISGAGTNEHGKLMWARVKGKTESDLTKLPFRRVYNFRPGIIEPTKGLKNTLKPYRYIGWLLPLIRLVLPNSICSLRELGLAMIHSVENGYGKQVLEVRDIKKLAEE